ncbi:MAG: class I SAM-dependent rRNA methyltransferase [Methylococcales bacterium]|nr:class I SAM-dependent rRNA methyltransferase [Methylococcales bacterium]
MITEYTRMTDTFPAVVLKSKEEHRIRSGHCWVYSNEINTQRSPLKSFEAGEIVKILTAKDQFLGYGYINPNTLLCVRIVSRNKKYGITESVIKHHLQNALQMRELLYPSPFYRLVHGEGDFLPGLVIDRYGDFLVCQFNTAGMQGLKETIVEILTHLVKPKGILIRSDLNQRKIEGLEDDHEVIFGDIPDEAEVLTPNGTFLIPLKSGQKTGWFYDQTENRQQTVNISKNKTALDLFSYVGSWGIGSAIAGAKSVVCVDSSQTALDYVEINAKRNNVADRVTTIKSDANTAAKQLIADGDRFDLVMVDPPAFIKRKKDVKNGLEAYRRTNEIALRLTKQHGFFFSSSCSFHMPLDRFQLIIHQAARHVDRQLQRVYQGQQDKDHPVHPAMPETNYLKHAMYHVNIS